MGGSSEEGAGSKRSVPSGPVDHIAPRGSAAKRESLRPPPRLPIRESPICFDRLLGCLCPSGEVALRVEGREPSLEHYPARACNGEQVPSKSASNNILSIAHLYRVNDAMWQFDTTADPPIYAGTSGVKSRQRLRSPSRAAASERPALICAERTVTGVIRHGRVADLCHEVGARERTSLSTP